MKKRATIHGRHGLVLALLLALLPAGQALGAPAAITAEQKAEADKHGPPAKVHGVPLAEFRETVSKLEPHVHEKNGQLVLDEKDAARLGLRKEALRAAKKLLAATNKELRSKKITPADLRPGRETVAADVKAAAKCKGKNEINRHWWGVEIYVDDCKVKAIGAGGGTAATICGLMPPSCPFSGAIAIVAGAMVTMNEVGGNKGVIVYHHSGLPPWIAPQ
jgi:hypothetical protein